MIFFVLLNSSSNQKKSEEEKDGIAPCQDTSGKNESSPEKAKERRTMPGMPPVRYAAFLNFKQSQ